MHFTAAKYRSTAKGRIPVFSMISHFICCFNSHPGGYDGSCAAAALSSPAWRIKNGVSQRDTPETRRFHSIHTPTGRVWNGKGLSHGLKTCHWHVFLTPFRVPPFLLKVAVRQKGLVTLRSIRRKRRMATVHWTVAFYCSSPFYLEYKNGVSRMGYTRNMMFPFHPHPYGARLE